MNAFHEEISQQMSLALDGALSPEEERRLRAHLQECLACAALWEEMQGISGLFERPPLLAPPPDLTAKVMRRVGWHERWRAWARRLAIFSLVGLLTAMVLAIPLIGISTLAVNHPALSQAILRALVRAAEVGRILWKALAMILRAFLGQTEWIALCVWLLIAVGLGVGWVRLVSRAARKSLRVVRR